MVDLIEDFFNNNTSNNLNELMADVIAINNLENNGVTLNSNIKQKLFDYQIDHTTNIVNCLINEKKVIDGSDTGTGKTYTTIAACRQLRLKPFIICPKSILNTWIKVCKYFNVPYLGVINYETIRNGKYYDPKTNKKIKCPYLIDYEWKLPKDSILIFDEVHRCRHINTLNGKLLYAGRDAEHCLLLSATIIDSLEDFKIYGYVLGLYDNINQGINWILRVNNMQGLHKKIYPLKGSRMKISDLGDKFPSNQISVDTYTISNENTKKIQSLYEQMKTYSGKNIYVKILRARQHIELSKVPLFVELTNDLLNTGMSVVIFVNFTDTLNTLSKVLKTTCLVHGKQSLKERDNNIEQFMKNKERVIICNMRSGSQAISLHDKYGGYPRVSLISPSFSSTDLIQALGRIHRAGSKSPALQKIMLCAGTVEDIIAKNIKKKLECISMINDDDMNNKIFV